MLNQLQIPLNEIQFANNSWADDVGRLFFWKDRVFRGIFAAEAPHINRLLNSGLIEELVMLKLFPGTWKTDLACEGFAVVIEHERISPVIYPVEWSFAMLKNVAQVILKINTVSNKYGYQLKDCHGGNVLFRGSSAVFVDLGSFIHHNSKCDNWVGYEEFVRFYYYPLKIWSNGDHFTARRYLFSEYGFMPNATIYFHMNAVLRFLVPKALLLRVIDLKMRYYRSDLKVLKSRTSQSSVNSFLKGLLEYLVFKAKILKQKPVMKRLEKKIRLLTYKDNTKWGIYHDENFDSSGNMRISDRFHRLIEVLNNYSDIQSAVDVAGNQGFFSDLIRQYTHVNVVHTLDYDELAVDKMYNRAKDNSLVNGSIALSNLMRPIVNRDMYSPSTRFQSDAVFALAVTHHLLLTQGYPIRKVLESIILYSSKYVFIEFMPLGLWDGMNSQPIPDWYNVDWFRHELEEYCTLLLEEKIETNRVLFVGVKRN